MKRLMIVALGLFGLTVWADPIVVGDFAALQKAIDESVDGETIQLSSDIDITTNVGVSVPGTTWATIDLAGHKLRGFAYEKKTSYVIYNRGVLTVIDSSVEKTGEIVAEATTPDLESVPGYASNAITNYGHLVLDGVSVTANGSDGLACYAVDNDAENAQWQTTCYSGAKTKLVYLSIVNGAKLRTASSSTVRQYLDSDEIWWNVVEMDGADMGSFWLQDNYQSSTKKGYYALGILSIKNTSFLYSVTLGYFNVAGYVRVTLENSSFTSVYNNLAQYFSVYPEEVTVKDCRFEYYFMMAQPKKCLKDGLYGHDTYTSSDKSYPLSLYVLDGYEVQANKDVATKEKYPFTIGLIAKVPETVIAAIVDSETAEKYAAGDPEAKREVEEKLESRDENGNKVWENYVMGVKGDEVLNVHAEQEHADKIELKLANEAIAPADSGYDVSYEMDFTDADNKKSTLDTLDIDLAAGDPTGIYQVKAVLTPTNGGTPIEVITSNKVGVVKATQPTEIAVIAVPWKQFLSDDEHISVSNLVKTANLTPGDKLYIYQGEKYDVWVLDEAKSWQQATSVSSENGAEVIVPPTGSSSDHTVTQGIGVFLERQNSAVPYYLYGQVDEAAEGVTVVTEERTPIANPNLKPFDLNGFYYNAEAREWKFAVEANEGDIITIPLGKTQRKCTYKDGKWGYNQKTVVDGVLQQTWIDEVKIPAGTGCWYIKNGSKDVTINWASQK